MRWVVYEDVKDKMVPMRRGKALRVFTSYKDAVAARPWFGVVAPVERAELANVCKRFGFRMPKGKRKESK